jgi:mRNA-degrading endonuclease RelE of RelBE toxin-antitoxin system
MPACRSNGSQHPILTHLEFRFLSSASEAIQKLSKEQRDLLRAYLNSNATQLNVNPQLRFRFPDAFQT